MSYSATYHVYASTARRIDEYRNGHGTASVLWALLSDKYLGVGPYGYTHNKADTDRLWKLYLDPRVPNHLRICHLWTFDNAFWPLDVRETLVDACEETFLALRSYNGATVNHWHQLAIDLQRIPKKPRCYGIGLTCTSVSDGWSEYAYRRGKDVEPWDAHEQWVEVLKQEGKA